MKANGKRPERRGGWSGGPVSNVNNWPLALACLAIGAGALLLMVVLTR